MEEGASAASLTVPPPNRPPVSTCTSFTLFFPAPDVEESSRRSLRFVGPQSRQTEVQCLQSSDCFRSSPQFGPQHCASWDSKWGACAPASSAALSLRPSVLTLPITASHLWPSLTHQSFLGLFLRPSSPAPPHSLPEPILFLPTQKIPNLRLWPISQASWTTTVTSN